MLKSDILKKLRDTRDYVSGQELCDEYGVSRTAVWKAVNSLRNEGFVIDSVQNRGYRLVDSTDVFSCSILESCIKTEWLGKSLLFFDEIDSTNTELKRRYDKDSDIPHGMLAITDNQVQGRGRRGRGWQTPKGVNVAMSFLLKPSFPPEKASMLTILMAMAVAKGIQDIAGAECKIKWPNDVLINKRKICGILTEMSSEPDYIHYVIVGTGINVNTEGFPEEIKDIAGSIYTETGKRTNRAELVARILEFFEDYYKRYEKDQDLSGVQQEYNDMLVSMDSEVRVLDPKGEYCGISRGINPEGELMVQKDNGELVAVYAGEVSVRGVYGYA